MIKTIAFLMFFISPFLQSSNDCNVAPKGNFIYYNKDGTHTKIKRTKKKQIEISSEGDSKIEYNIYWINDCEYLLHSRNVLKGIDEYPYFNSDTLHVKIKSIDIPNNKIYIESRFKVLSTPWFEGELIIKE